MEKIEALAKFLGIETNKIKESINNDGIFEIENGERYMVLTDDEAEKTFYDYESNLIEECGLDAFTDWARARGYIIENCLDVDWFEDYFKRNNTYDIDQKKNYLNMRNDLITFNKGAVA